MSKEWSTFADGYDCRDCVQCEREVVQLKSKLAEKDAELLLITNRISSKDAIIEKLKEQVTDLHEAIEHLPGSNMIKKVHLAEFAELEKGDKV